MFKTRVFRVLIVTLMLTGLLVAGGAWVLTEQDRSFADQSDLDRAAAYRFEHMRGMSSCEDHHRDTVTRARAAFLAAGLRDAPLIGVVTPTFEGAMAAGFHDTRIEVLHFSGATGYSNAETWFQTLAADPVTVSLTPEASYALQAPLVRLARYPNAEVRGGFDGNSYVLSWGDACARTWSPRKEDGPSAGVAAILDALGTASPSAQTLDALARSITEQERATTR